MLYSIKQYINLFNSFIINNFAESFSESNFNNLTGRDGFLNGRELKKAKKLDDKKITDFINDLDKAYKYLNDGADIHLDSKVDFSKAEQIMLEYKRKIKKNTKVNIVELKGKVNDFKDEEIGSSNFDVAGYNEFLSKLQEELDISEIDGNDVEFNYIKRVDIPKEDEILGFKHKVEYDIDNKPVCYLIEDVKSISSFSDIKKLNKDEFSGLLKSFGYEDNRGFISQLFSNGEKNIKNSLKYKSYNINKLNDKELSSDNKFNLIKDYLSDFDFDGILETKANSNVSEIHKNITIKNIDQVKHLVSNLGLDYDNMSNIDFKNKFNDRLTSLLYSFPLEFLLKDGGIKEFNDEVKVQREIIEKENKEITKVVESSEFLQVINDFFTENDIENNSDNIKVVRDFTIAAMTGYNNSIGVGVEIFRFAEGIVGSVNLVELAKGNSGFSIDVNLLKEKLGDVGIDINSGLSFPHSLYIDITGSVRGGSELSKHGTTLSFGGNISSLGGVAKHISLKEYASDNIDGYNQIMLTTTKILDHLIEHTEDENLSSDKVKELFGEDITDNEISIVQNNYIDFREQYGRTVGEGVLEKEEFRNNILKTIASFSFKQVEGARLTGLGAFIVPGIVSGVFITGEYNYRILEKTSRGLAEDRAEIKLSTINDIVNYVGNDEYLKENIKVHNDSIIINNDVKVNTLSKNIFTFPVGLGVGYRASEGNRLELTINSQKTYDKDNNSIIEYTIDIDEVDEFISITKEKIPLDIFEYNNENVISHLDKLEPLFDHNTRYKQGAYDVMNPNIDFVKRWDALSILAKNTSSDFTIFSLIGKAETDKDKEFIISKISQYLRKSKEANITERSVLDIIDTDIKRNKIKDKKTVFDQISIDNIKYNEGKDTYGVDLSDYRNKFYEISKGLFKGKPDSKYKKSSIDNAVGFDIVSSLVKGKSAIKGVDLLKGNIGAVANELGEAIKVEIDKENDINAIIETLVGKDNTYIIDSLKNGVKSGDLKINFVKSTGYDDCIVLEGDLVKYLTVNTIDNSVIGTGTKGSDIIKNNYHTIGGLLVYTFDEMSKEPVKKEIIRPIEEETVTGIERPIVEVSDIVEEVLEVPIEVLVDDVSVDNIILEEVPVEELR